MRITSSLSCLLLGVFLAACEAGPPKSAVGVEAAEDPAGLENASFTAELNGFEIHYEVRGRGPVLMVLPNSWGLSLEGLRALYRPLEENLTLVYFDQRGIGGSAPVREDSDMGLAAVREDFDALRRHLGLEQVNAIGWSNGATNLILLAAEKPETLKSAIFLHSAARFAPEDFQDIAERYPEWVEAAGALEEELAREELSLEERSERLKRFSVEEGYVNLFADPEAGREILPRIWAEAEFSYAHGRYSQGELTFFDGRQHLSAITARSLVIAGAHDLLPPERAEEIHQGIADSRFLVLEESGHFSPVEEPEAFKSAVVDFLRDSDS
jgi:proline iminopeptidase